MPRAARPARPPSHTPPPRPVPTCSRADYNRPGMSNFGRLGACAVIAFAVAAAHSRAQATQAAQGTAGPDSQITAWFCAMHQGYTTGEAGKCPICGMALIAGNPYDTRDYDLDFTTSPAAVASGVPFTMTFTTSGITCSSSARI